MPKTVASRKIKKAIEKFSQELRKSKFNFQYIYLFGSYARGQEHKWSDIDVAVVSDVLKNNWEKRQIVLWRASRKTDSRIEPYGFTVSDFKNNTSPMVWEVKKTGIRIV